MLGEEGRRADRLHVLSCYAPTYSASRAEKDKFYDSLQQVLDAIPSNELLVDFNTRIRSRLSASDEWEHVRGPHGYGEVNEVGRKLLSFLSLNGATVCNTWYEKKAVFKQSWQHRSPKNGTALIMQLSGNWIIEDV